MGVNWADKTVWTGDNLPIMRGMNSASVDLIYLDPPFNSKTDYAAPIGSQAAGAAFKDTWSLSDIDVEWVNLLEVRHPDLARFLRWVPIPSDKSYLTYMAVRLLEMRRLLKPSGSIYLHCDPTMSHYLKLVMDAVFGRGNFRNEIVWAYTGPSNTKRWFPRKHDVVLFYTAGNRWTFRRDAVRVPYKQLNIQHQTPGGGIGGALTPSNVGEYRARGKVPEDWWADLSPVARLKKERVGYPTQKPLSLLSRIIAVSSNPDDVVFDPFCGCATTLVAADDLGRQWAGIDISPKAAELVVRRIEERQGLFRDITHRQDIPQRTDLGDLPPPRSHRQALYGAQGGDCAGCREHFKPHHFEVDHIIARAKGGTDHPDNLQLLCGHCNRVKGDRGMEYLRAKLQIPAGAR
ncbi:MAG: DNA methyltransferase [bacterium]|nr:DNA methyltransferase [bacterium]